MKVKIGCNYSDIGSALGFSLFLTFVNDLSEIKSDTELLAYDVKVHVIKKNITK